MKKPGPMSLAFFVFAAAAVTWAAMSQLHAQEPVSTQEFIMSPGQVRALLAARANRLGYVPGQTLVKFRAGMAPLDQTRALSGLRRGTIANATMTSIGDAVLVDTPNDPDSVTIAETLARQPEVEWAQPNYLRARAARPNDAAYSSQWNLDLIGMPAAWDINQGGSSAITIAVVDFGVTTTNTTLSLRLWTGQQFETVAVPFAVSPDLSSTRIKAGRDFVLFRNGSPVLDTDGHGSLVAAVALEETNNSVGTAGIAYRASLLPLKACLSYWDLQILRASINQPGFADPEEDPGCPDAAIAEAIRFAADSGAQVINVSLGGGGAAPILRDAIVYAVSRGSFVALAAGNDFNNGNPIEYPAAYAEQISGAMAVGAVTRSSRRASYSSTGSYIEIAAPGGDFADGGANGAITQVTPDFDEFDPGVRRPRFDRYALFSVTGTSVAAPHIAGIAALLFSQGLTSPAAIETWIANSATDLGPPGRDNEFGAGLVNGRAAMRGMGLAK
jgi:serine protease